MKRYLKICSVAFLAGVGAARVLVWLNTGIAHLLIMRGGWEVAEAVKARAVGACCGGLWPVPERERDACRQQALRAQHPEAAQRSDRDREPARCPAGCMTWV